jgi:hypothetical protein
MLHEKAIARAATGAGASIDFAGEWVNELGSKVEFIQQGDAIAGKYESAKSADGSIATGVLQGYVNGDLISFVVHWDKFQAITAWVGQLDPEAETQTIATLWQMTKQVSEGDEWASINAGADYFTRA